ncbi:efflux RND transporter periplasmic adaptor subunit [Pseudomonas sp. DC3000-4b1]|uniref:efflux RND transporter periplasmic adaptor subunit n=1 Tax=unclassified Pseudomonas TaxID=196821 RepID=UPI003CF5F7F2
MLTVKRFNFPWLPLALALGLAGCDQAPLPSEAAVPRSVEVQVVASEPFTPMAQLPGRVEPVRVAEVRARVAGIVLKQRFEEGADVKAGDLLFEIDPAPLKAAVAHAEGELGRAQASVLEARARLKRYQQLVDSHAISAQDFDTASANLQLAQADVRSAQASLDTARLNLGYASVRAPISGRIGRALVTEGGLVGQSEATLMARIQQLDPIYVDFNQPVADALRLREALQNRSKGTERTLSVQVEGTELHREGVLLFTDVSVDRGTGQVTLRGRFANPDAALLPGMYVRVTAPQGPERPAVFVPQRAVSRDATGQARVMVVGQGQQAEVRQIETGIMLGGRWQVLAGLAPGDHVIVSALVGLAPGAPVTPQTAPAR